MQIVMAPTPLETVDTKNRMDPVIFLAGSIENGAARDWQQQTIDGLVDTNAIILNPRRADWDWSWEQRIDNPTFYEQVNWELDALTFADIIFLHFEPETKSPISLLEFGLFASSGKLIVHCPEGFWRKGNVDIVCERYEIEQVNTIEEGISLIRQHCIPN